MKESIALGVYQGPAGDHNDRAKSAVPALGAALEHRLRVSATVIGEPTPARPAGWETELRRARHSLAEMAAWVDTAMTAGRRPISAITRCAVALATQPVVLRHRPDTVVVWLDAHGDINTPDDTATGYLGGMALSGPLGWWDSGMGAGLPASQAILVGARDLDPAEVHRLDSGSVTLVTHGPHLGERLEEAIGGRPTYLHLDCDVLDPGLFTTDYSVPNGLGLADLHDCAVAAARGEVVGLELGEYEGDGTADADDLVEAIAPLLDALVIGDVPGY